MRAYAGAARECLRQAPKIQVKRLVDVCIKVQSMNHLSISTTHPAWLLN